MPNTFLMFLQLHSGFDMPNLSDEILQSAVEYIVRFSVSDSASMMSLP